MSWKTHVSPNSSLAESSSSLWGCELKSLSFQFHAYNQCHPPCEDVSWKLILEFNIENNSSSSLWGCELKNAMISVELFVSHVILLVRMWVEKSWGVTFKIYWNVILLVRMWVEKTHLSWHRLNRLCHPPCEDVSWKINDWRYKDVGYVILLVRMWVENVQRRTASICWNVILLVRMWVEKSLVTARWIIWASSSLWGCELKIVLQNGRTIRHWSSSLWGCELKNICGNSTYWCDWSSSLWGCELKSLAENRFLGWCSHPPCEDVSWKFIKTCALRLDIVILLVRMWVEKKLSRSCVRVSTVILLVRMWVEKVQHQKNQTC